MTSVGEAFKRARIQAVRHMTECDRARLRWSEPTITEIVMAHASRAVTVVPFTQHAEAVSGADWIWWWVDSAGAYGMLVQAKRVTVTRDGWHFGFGYKTKGSGSSQREALCSTAAELGVLPVYALYLGTGAYRGWEPCGDVHRRGRCIHCVKRSVSLMPALLADERYVFYGEPTYERSVALEDLWTCSRESAPLIPALQTQLAPDLGEFLQTRQDGTRAVSRSMMDRVLTARFGEFYAVPATAPRNHIGDHDQLGSVFGDVPDDTGHWGLSYFEHVLNPLRHTPPSYVRRIMTGEFDEDYLASVTPGNAAGIVVVRVPEQE